VAKLKNLVVAGNKVDAISDEIENHPLFDEDEIL